VRRGISDHSRPCAWLWITGGQEELKQHKQVYLEALTRVFPDQVSLEECVVDWDLLSKSLAEVAKSLLSPVTRAVLFIFPAFFCVFVV
jgi:hypothetical protein